MKSAYEIAMERLEKNAPTKKLTDDQLARIREIDSQYQAKIAEREVFLKSQRVQAAAQRQFDEIEKIDKQLASEVVRLREEWEEKKNRIRGEA
jgi:hypothetical protein